MDAVDRANQLYWGSDESVNRIADALDLSKGALYEMIRPLPAGLGCPLCGTEVVHPNRTAKDRGHVDCPSCAWSGSEQAAVAAPSSVARESGAGTEPVDDPHALDDFDARSPPARIPAGGPADGGRLIAGGALLGAAVGLALVLWARRR